MLSPVNMIAFGDSSEVGVGGVIIPTFGVLLGETFESWGPSTRHNGGANMLFCDGHVEYGKLASWVEHRDDVLRRWNRDNQPHRRFWTYDLLKHMP